MRHSTAPKPVTVNGVQYASLNHAAQELGVNHPTVGKALKRGTLDNIGKSSDNRGYAQSIKVGPYTFPSYSEAARTLKVSHAFIRKWKDTGQLETRLIILLQKRKEQKTNAHQHRHAEKIRNAQRRSDEHRASSG